MTFKTGVLSADLREGTVTYNVTVMSNSSSKLFSCKEQLFISRNCYTGIRYIIFWIPVLFNKNVFMKKNRADRKIKYEEVVMNCIFCPLFSQSDEKTLRFRPLAN